MVFDRFKGNCIYSGGEFQEPLDKSTRNTEDAAVAVIFFAFFGKII